MIMPEELRWRLIHCCPTCCFGYFKTYTKCSITAYETTHRELHGNNLIMLLVYEVLDVITPLQSTAGNSFL